MNISKKTFVISSITALMLCTTSAFAATSVWKVSKGDDYLYVGGTVHMLPESAFPLPAEFELAYKDADALILEAKLPESDDKEFQAKVLTAMSYQNGNTLSKNISTSVYQQLADYFAQYGVQINQLESFKPGFISLQIFAIEMQKAKISGEGVDTYFAKRAKEDKKGQHYLESIDSQLNLIANFGQGYEDSFMKYSLQHTINYSEQFANLVSAWQQGDLVRLNNLTVTPLQQLSSQMYQDMLVKRNQAWLPQIEQMFTNNERELVLVGAGHLAGEHSVLALLDQAGYQLEQIVEQ